MDISVHLSWCTYRHISCVYIPRCEIYRSEVLHTFSKFCQFVFQSGCTNFHPHLKYTIAPNPLQHLMWSDGTLGHFVLFLKVMLVDLEWYVMVILFSFFIDYWNQILLFVYWPFEYIPLWNIFHIFCVVFYWVIYLFLKYLLDFLISYGYKSFVGYLIFIGLLRLSILLRLFKEPSFGFVDSNKLIN